MIKIEKSDPHSADSQRMIEQLSKELAAITGDSGKSNFTMDSLEAGRSLWALARNEKGDPIGCGAIRPLSESTAELKRMFSDRSEPGIGNLLLAFLETSAKSMGYGEICLETRHVNHRAISFYKKHGYRIIENYGPYIGRAEAACLSKTL